MAEDEEKCRHENTYALEQVFEEVVESPALEMLKNGLGKDTEQPTVGDPVLSGGLLD